MRTATRASGDLVDAIKGPVGLTFAGILGASALKHGVIDPMRTNAKVRKSKKELYKKYPNLKHEDPKKVKDYFNVVKQYSPHAAANPLVAGSLVNKMVQFGGVDHKMVQDLVDIEHGTTAHRNNMVSTAIKGGAGMI